MSESKHARIIRNYIKLRNRQKALRAKFKEIDDNLTEQMEEIEQAGVGLFKQDGAATPESGSMSCDYGRVHYKLETKYQCRDAEQLRDWILKDPASRIDILQMRPVQAQVAAQPESVPGIHESSKHRAIFTKPSPKKK